jgi:hypothetical protein
MMIFLGKNRFLTTTLFEKKENPTDYYSFGKHFAKWQKFNTKKNKNKKTAAWEILN